MPLATASGARIFLGSTTARTTLDGYDEESWLEIGTVEDLGEMGDEAEDVTFVALTDGRKRHLKGPVDGGTIPVTCGLEDDDPGQLAMVEAMDSHLNFNFKVVYNNAATLMGTGSERYFRGKLMSNRENVGNASNVLRAMFKVGIDSATLRRAAT